MIKIHRPGTDLTPVEPKLHLFAGGETHAVVDPHLVRHQKIWVEAHVSSMVDMGYLMCTLDAIIRSRPLSLGLYIPYFPGARQDHPEPGTPGTMQIYVDMLRRFDLDVTVVADPHSAVLPAMMPCEIISAGDILGNTKTFEYNGIIAPDAGAEKRAAEVAKEFGGLPVFTAHKIREQATGRITSFKMDKLEMGHYLLVDDICDGGATFNILAESVRRGYNAGGPVLDLYVTHGIFSKGYSQRLSNFEKIYTTN